MSPEETELARALVALPGFPKFDDIGGVYLDGEGLWFALGLVWFRAIPRHLRIALTEALTALRVREPMECTVDEGALCRMWLEGRR